MADLRLSIVRRADRQDWLVISILIIAAALTIFQGIVSLTAETSPDVALRLDPGNGIANVVSAERALAQSNSADAAFAARRALIRSPALAGAARSLGLAVSLAGRQSEALAAFRYAETLSRRDLGTNLWLIEFAVGQNDIVSALHQYDIALRTSSSAYKTLFPILAKTLDDPEYTSPVVKIISTKPPWSDNFIEFIFNARTPPLDLDRLALAMSKKNVPFNNDLERTLIERLVTAGEYEAAWRVYLRIQPEMAKTKNSIRNRFFESERQPTLFDWQYVNTGESISQLSHDKNVVEFKSFSESEVPLLSQLTLLKSGHYLISTKVHVEIGNSNPYWTLTCVSDNRLLGRVSASLSATQTTFASVDPDCPAQWLRLIIPGSTIVPTSGTLQSVRIVSNEAKSPR